MPGFKKFTGGQCPVLEDQQESNVRFWKISRSSMSGFQKSAGVQCPVLENQQESSTVVFENECTVGRWLSTVPIQKDVKSQFVKSGHKIPWFQNSTVQFPYHGIYHVYLGFWDFDFPIHPQKILKGIVPRNFETTVFWWLFPLLQILHGLDPNPWESMYIWGVFSKPVGFLNCWSSGLKSPFSLIDSESKWSLETHCWTYPEFSQNARHQVWPQSWGRWNSTGSKCPWDPSFQLHLAAVLSAGKGWANGLVACQYKLQVPTTIIP